MGVDKAFVEMKVLLSRFVADITRIGDFNVLSFDLFDEKSQFYVTLRELTFARSSEERCWLRLAWVYRPHMIVLEAQTAPRVAQFQFIAEDPCPVSTKQTSSTWKISDSDLLPVWFRKCESCLCIVFDRPKILFFLCVRVRIVFELRENKSKYI